MLSEEENTAELIEPPTQEEINSAVTGNLSNLLVVVSVAVILAKNQKTNVDR